jgi:sigma-B regulation protein RsbU (phosphoserine phosphatase)
VLSSGQDDQPQALARTGMPLGILDDVSWERGRVQLKSGDALFTYTDGIIETQDEKGEFYKEDRLLDVIVANLGGSAKVIKEAVIEDVEKFRGTNPRFDDMTFVVIKWL